MSAASNTEVNPVAPSNHIPRSSDSDIRTCCTDTAAPLSQTAWRLPSTPPINRLPVEILTMIFVWLTRMHKDIQNLQFEGAPPQYIGVMRVCKLWNDIALNTVELWQKVSIGEYRTTADRLSAVLARSRSASLDIKVRGASGTLRLAAPFLLREAHRLRTLNMAEYDDGVEAVDALLLSAVEFPRLETLVVLELSDQHYPFGVTKVAECLVSLDAENRFPSLRSLELRCVYIPWRAPVFQTLRAFILVDCHAPSNISLPEFLAALRRCERLEELEIHYTFMTAFPDVDPNGFPVVPEYPIAILPRLHSLLLQNWPSTWYQYSPSDIHVLLQHLRIPPTAGITINLEIDREEVGGYEDDAGIVYPPEDYGVNVSFLTPIPQDSACLPLLCNATSITLMASHVECSQRKRYVNIECTREPEAGTLRVIFNEFTSFHESARWPYPQSNQLRDVCTLFARAPLTSLTVELLDATSDVLMDMFHTFSALTNLHVYCTGDGQERELLTALAPPHLTSHPGSAVLPALRILRLERVAWPACPLTRIIFCIWVRRAQGAATLSELHITFNDRDTEDVGGVARHYRALAALKNAVEGLVVCSDATIESDAKVSKYWGRSCHYHAHLFMV
ncbi:uncharacterized protein TRAVEDRAFT_21852 [Trametes versicolor FP-101664 SS1]|uniref:uncharacterized protein n=1 Tax=Trametes versicolor (strain FP-101664) TaxID=717944 RepID=UPI0004622583|nr:uncharacterized protein TRAVEDRAFT_21852 [Trametes versicolor FP-101664 SS1]EIW56858.1 hypothetical protein TRAVEDRAFT_21852 [Trametes versicolor FP-101664 SS1]